MERVASQIDAYAPIAEDVLGLKVFEKAKGYLINWITLGGVTALIASLALFGAGWKYAVDVIDGKMKSIASTEISSIVQKEAERQVGSYFKDHSEEYNQRVEQLTVEIVRQTSATFVTQLGYKLAPGAPPAEPNIVATSLVVDYSPQMQPVRSLGQEGSVVGFAIAAALEYQIFKTTGQKVRISPRGIYNLAKIEGTVDAGATISEGLRVVQTKGAVLEEVWPYKSGEYAAPPPPGFATAQRFKIKTAQKLKGTDQVKAVLQVGGPVIAGITVYPSFESQQVTKTGIVPMPKAKETVLGGMAICIVGYDDTKKVFKFLNFWGDAWGDKGYGYLPYDYLTDNAGEIWAITV
jgi:C1A family cysteine protease